MFRRSEGSTAVEFAIIAPILFLLLCSIFEYSLISFADVELASGLAELSRKGMTGQLDNNQTSPDALKVLLLQQLYPAGFFNASNLSIYPETFTSFGNISSSCAGNVTGFCSGGYMGGTSGVGSGGNASVYLVTYKWDIITPMLSAINGGNNLMLYAATLIKNEPFTPGGR